MNRAADETTPRDWTVDDYLELGDGDRFELLEGELVGCPPPSVSHQRVATRLGTILDSIALAYDLGICFDAPLEVILSNRTVVQPDLAFYREDRDLRTVEDRALLGVPDMVVEVTTRETAAYTRGPKRNAYARAGVPWLIFVDVTSRTAETYRRTDQGQFTWKQTADADDILEVPPHPEISVELSKVWPDWR